MSTHKHIDRICVVIIVTALILTLLFMNGQALGLEAAERSMGYEETLFDTSRVHTIDIVIQDWDAFIETCESETYSACSLVIDGEVVKNVAIRGKGNTSLSSVKSLGSQRYSFKIEFDQYQDGRNYHGLDKLSLNNIIQDNSYMKDYLAYRLMGEFGVTAPLCSYVYLTVNGEDWGLYLAVEGVEDSFLQRNYGRDTGELYKPDSMSFGGGGPGNGKNFNMEDFFNQDSETSDGEGSAEGNTETGGTGSFSGNFGDFSGFGGMTPPEDFDASQFGEGGSFDFGGMTPPEGFDAENFDPSQLFGQGAEGEEDSTEGGRGRGGGFGGFDFGGIFGGMGSTDVKLQYIDDDPDSYSNIFNNAKTDVNQTDKNRLIEALKKLSQQEDIENTVDVEEVIRYFVVHNFVCNGDSYTGSIIHNYYLHEQDGQLSMIPWDYNLAFGTFQGGDATDVVNDPIDNPMSASDGSDRPMWGWIAGSGEYTDLYHAYFAEFLETVDITGIIDEAYGLIKDYVAKDPTAFCTYEEFETAVATMRTFCTLRTESVKGQLEGTIPSTTEGQRTDSSALVDASGITLSDMGSQGGTRGGGFGGGQPGQSGGSGYPGGSGGSGEDGSGSSGFPSQGGGSFGGFGGGQPGQGGGFSFPGGTSGFSGGGFGGFGDAQPGQGGMPDFSGGSFDPSSFASPKASGSSWLTVGLCTAVLLLGILVAVKYKRY